jgi:hypothetical protein
MTGTPLVLAIEQHSSLSIGLLLPSPFCFPFSSPSFSALGRLRMF